MRSFVHAAVFAVAISAPALAGALMDHSAVSVLGAPGSGCSSSCDVGGAAPGSPAQGGHLNNDPTLGSGSASGTLAVPGGQTTGHINQTAPDPVATVSGNFNTIPSSKGHCTGAGSSLCS
jgi:hypothetical protein